MAEIRISERDFEKLRNHLLSSGNNEEAAIAMAGLCYRDGKPIFIVREVIPVKNQDFQTKGGVFLQIDPEYLAWIIKRCRFEKLAFILAHSHPFSGNSVGFSSIDDSGEEVLVPKLKQHILDIPHVFLVFGQNAVAGRYWPPDDKTCYPIQKLKIIGERIQTIYTSNSMKKRERENISKIYHRQSLAIGEQMQTILHTLHVAVVGVGGIGSQIFIQLAHLGVGKITLVDDDVLEETDRSRIISSCPNDAGVINKVTIMKRYAEASCPEVNVLDVKGNIEYVSIARKLLKADVIFCCTDNVRSRVVLNRISYQYYIPLMDTGVHLQKDNEGKLRSGIGRIMLIQPDGPCLECTQIINDSALQRETSSETRGTYVTGGETIHEPQIISINGVVASLAVTRLLDIIGGFQRRRLHGTYEAYRPLDADLKVLDMKREVNCTLCSEIRGFGDVIALPCKIETN